jgi:hypothetical protein
MPKKPDFDGVFLRFIYVEVSSRLANIAGFLNVVIRFIG